MFDNVLYVADNDKLIKVTLDGQTEVIAAAKDFPGKAVFLNDIEIDGNGNVFISDSGDDNGKNAGIYKVTPDGHITEVINEKSGIKRPNGLLNDGVNQMLVADFGTGDLFTLDLASGTVDKVNQGFGGADGLVRDANGLLYVSDWNNGKVWQLVEPKATPQLLRDDFKAAADIALSADGKQLLVPDMKAGTLEYLPVR
jgi:sugar lactone lactonase YvrE